MIRISSIGGCKAMTLNHNPAVIKLYINIQGTSSRRKNHEQLFPCFKMICNLFHHSFPILHFHLMTPKINPKIFNPVRFPDLGSVGVKVAVLMRDYFYCTIKLLLFQLTSPEESASEYFKHGCNGETLSYP